MLKYLLYAVWKINRTFDFFWRHVPHQSILEFCLKMISRSPLYDFHSYSPAMTILGLLKDTWNTMEVKLNLHEREQAQWQRTYVYFENGLRLFYVKD